MQYFCLVASLFLVVTTFLFVLLVIYKFPPQRNEMTKRDKQIGAAKKSLYVILNLFAPSARVNQCLG